MPDKFDPQMQYYFSKRIIELYSLLQDRKSRDIFWARLMYETEPRIERALELVRQIGPANKNTMILGHWRDEYFELKSQEKRIILYGAGTMGMTLSKLLRNSRVEFYGFCDKKRAGEVVDGKEVISPEQLFRNADRYYVIIGSERYRKEIVSELAMHAFPADHILHWFEPLDKKYQSNAVTQTRFDYFPINNYIRPNTSFIDAGCYDGLDTIQLAKLRKDLNTKIISFEPDLENYHRCLESIEFAKVANVELIQAALGKKSGKAVFLSSAGCGSYLKSVEQEKSNVFRPNTKKEKISVFALDDTISDEIGIIKMDIEGAEYDALYGAKETIRRSKPVLVICVYHRVGDMLAIMDYVHTLVPEYRLWLRHDGPLDSGTTLYATL